MLEIIDLVHDTLRASPELSGIREWNKANSLVTLAAPGCSIGIDEEKFTAYTRDEDEVTASLNIVFWVKHADPVSGEAEVRALAQAARKVLTINRTLGGAVDDSYVGRIRYATADGGKSLLLHLAEVEYQVTYYAGRFTAEDVPVIETYNRDMQAE